MGSPNRRYGLEHDFVFGPHRDGAALALRLLDLVGDRDARVRARIGAWLQEVIRILPPIKTGDRLIDELDIVTFLIAMLRHSGWEGHSDAVSLVDQSAALIEFDARPDEISRTVRGALAKAAVVSTASSAPATNARAKASRDEVGG